MACFLSKDMERVQNAIEYLREFWRSRRHRRVKEWIISVVRVKWSDDVTFGARKA